MEWIDDSLFARLLEEAANSPRRRSHFNLHKDYNEPVQRLCIALCKGTYVRPHHHNNKWENIQCLRGRVSLIIFDASGIVLERRSLSSSQGCSMAELPLNTWHCILPETQDAIIFEIKEGPYTPAKPEDFAEWAPAEGDAECDQFLLWAATAEVGDRFQNS